MSLDEAAVRAILTSKLHHGDFRIENFQIEQLSVDGMMGEYFQLFCIANIQTTERCETTKHTFFVKKKAKNQYEHWSERVFEKERASFEMFKTINLPGINCVSAKCFYSDDHHLVFEDLNQEGFVILTAGRVATEEELLLILDCLASMHSAGIAYEEREKRKNPEFNFYDKFSLAFEELYARSDNDMTQSYVRATIKGLITAIKVFELPERLENGKLFIDELEKLTGILNSDIPNKRFRNTISHGDLWPANIFIKRDCEGAPKCCKLVDFQIIRYYLPAFDVLDCILLNTSREYRREHLGRLKKYYFDQFSKCLREYGIRPEEIYTFEEYLESFKEIELLAHFLTLATIPMSYNVDWGTKQVMKGEGNNQIIFGDMSPLITNFLENEYLMGRIKGAILDVKEYFENN